MVVFEASLLGFLSIDEGPEKWNTVNRRGRGTPEDSNWRLYFGRCEAERQINSCKGEQENFWKLYFNIPTMWKYPIFEAIK